MKYTKQSKKIPFLLVLSSSAIISSLGYSTWINGDMLGKEDKIEVTPSTPVCYIGDVKYLTLDAALDAAYNNGKADTIYVIPDLGFDVTILKSHTLEKGDSLLLPYEGETVLNEKYDKDKDGSIKGFADNDVAKNRKTHVVLSANQTLTIKGTMTIGAFTGAESSPMGQASSSYSELEMGMNSTLNVEGNLNCYGFIKEGRSGSTIVVKDGGVLTTPVVFYDYTSASNAYKYYSNDVFPYKQFDVASIRSKMIFYYGASLIGRAHLWGSNAGNIITSANLIGVNSAFINMESSDSRVEWQFSDVDSTKTTGQLIDHRTIISFSGEGSIGSIGVTVYGMDVNSKNYYLPVPCGYTIVIGNSSKFTMPSNIKGVKFMPGSSLLCKEDSSLTLDTSVLFYQNTTATDGTSFTYPSTTAASFINNGAVVVNSGFEGVISTDTTKSKTASTTFSWLSTTVTDSKEESSKSTYNWGGGTGKISDASSGLSTLASFEIGTIYESELESDEWNKTALLPKDITSVSISSVSNSAYSDSNNSNVRSGTGKAGGFDLTANPEPSDYDSTDVSYSWKITNSSSGDTSGAHLQSNTGKSVTLLTDENSGDTDFKYTIEVIVSFTKVDGTKSSISSTIIITAVANSCILPTALVLMSNGTYKQAGSLRVGDEVMCFNHETGKIIPNKLIINSHIDEEAGLYDVVNLEFENNRKTSLVDEHAYFDVEENKYIYLNKDNARAYIGHRFVFIDNKLNRFTLKLEKVTVEKMLTKLAAPVSAYHLNVIVDDMLSIEGAISGLFNVFEYDPDTLAYDKEKMQRDIDKYGLTDYEAFKEYFPYEIFNELLPCQYFNVACGKGLLSWDIIKSYIAKWKNQLMENMK